MKTRYLLLSAVLALLLTACDRGEEPEEEPVRDPGAATDSPDEADLGAPDPAQAQATETAWEESARWLAQARRDCDDLRQAVAALLDTPESSTLDEARSAWRDCHVAWHRMAPVLTLSDSNPGLFDGLKQYRFAIDAHPIQPGYLDSLEQYPHSGIVNDIALPLNAENLREQHGMTDDSDVALGLHALEFLLWGEQGERPAGDYAAQTAEDATDEDSELRQSQLPHNRRRELVRLTAQLLQDDLKALEQAWDPEQGALGLTYHRLDPASREQLLRDALGHLVNTRLPEALNRLESEEETAHTPFAGNTAEPVLSALSGMDALLEAGDPALKAQLIPLASRSDWDREWADVKNWLDDEQTPNVEALRAALERLGPLLTRGSDDYSELTGG